MTDPWIPLLAQLPLSRTEREVVKRFEADPQGRTFLPVADILRSHRLIDESLELLTQGVERHPAFAVARVVLARELLQKGLVENAWRALEASPAPLKENILAQKLRFRLSFLLGAESSARSTYLHMQAHQMVDAETKKLGDLMEVTGFEQARDKVVKDLTDRGTQIVLPSPDQGHFAGVSAESAARPVEVRLSAAASTRGPLGGGSAYLRADQLDDDASVSGFHVVPLDEIFRPESDHIAPGAPTGTPRSDGGIELDSTTLAEIYERQGHYAKSLAVYRRLLRMTPNNDLLRRKVGEVSKLDREQRDVDLTVDPALVDRMEEVEIIDRQIRFFNDILGKLQ